MAKQHFYSRVPAKMSLFNKIDGYDTFACSDGLTKEFIEKELSEVYDSKPVKEDAEAVRNSALPTVYSRFTASDGCMVQSATSFIAADYTGERSSSLTHSLVLSQEEKKEHLCGYSSATLNPDVFQCDLSGFDLTSFDSVPYRDYPEKKVPVKKAASPAALADKYDTGMMKRLIYACLSVCSGKAKSLYLSLHADMATISADSLSFINRFLTIFPYHMREALSFVTYVGDIAKYSSFKIKFMPDERFEVPTSKGISIRLLAKDFTGIRDEDIAANAQTVDFFYSLLTNDDMRIKFLDFCAFAVEKNPSLEKITLKSITDLVLLFRVLSGFFDEKSVLPDDTAANDYITVYEKNRTSITDEYRANALKFLARYVEMHTAIPKNIFSRLVKIYPTETVESKHTVLSVILELIHTDAMRDKLLAFLRSNYDTEDAESKKAIMLDLCRVYYGGFLQTQILEFFNERFETEPEETRRNIIERLLLTVRTPAVQGSVLDFMKKYYSILSTEEKDKFYVTFYDMLPESDDLTCLFIDTVDCLIEENRQEEVREHLLAVVEKDEKRSAPKIAELIASKNGFCESVLAGKVFSDWSKRKVLETFLAALKNKDFIHRITTVDEIWRNAPSMKEEIATRLLNDVQESMAAGVKVNVFTAVEAIDILEKLKKDVPESASFVNTLEKDNLYAIAASAIPTAFDFKRFPDGIDRLISLAEKRKYLTESNEYADIGHYKNAVEASQKGESVACFVEICAINGQISRLGSAELLKKEFFNGELSDENRFIYTLCVEYLKSGILNFSVAAGAAREEIMRRARSQSNNTNYDALGKSVDEQTLFCVLSAVKKLYDGAISPQVKELFTKQDGELAKYVSQFMQKYEKKGKKYLSECLGTLTMPEELLNVLNTAPSDKASSNGFFSKLFRK